MRPTNLAVTLAALSLVAPHAKAAGQAAAYTVPTNLPGVHTFIAPAEDFNPLTASDEELAMFGFPPRPDAESAPGAYGSWRRAMLAAKDHVVPQLEITNIVHHRNLPISDGTEAGTDTSVNWSGVVDLGGASTYNHSTSFRSIFATWVVPVARQAFGACTEGTDYSFSWVGIDGYNSNDVLQAGSESDALCNILQRESSYYAWFEWWPNSSTRLTNLPVSAGNDMFVEIWNTTSKEGFAYIANLTTNQYVTLGLVPPPGTSLIGNSAEWVVERPLVNGELATLSNYVSDYFSDCYAGTFGGKVYTPGTASAIQVTMLDNSLKPISFPFLLGPTAIWLQDEGSARYK
jgi:Peptidase A4 family